MKAVKQPTLGAFVVASLVILAGLTPALAGISGDDAINTALSYVERNKQKFGLTGSDTNEIAVSSSVTSRSNGVTSVYLQQQYRGIEVFNAIITVNVLPSGNILTAESRFVGNIASLAGGQSRKKAAAEAAQKAADHLGLKATKAFERLEIKGGAAEAVTLSDAGIASGPIHANLVWLPLDNGALRLAWKVEIEEIGGNHWWYAFVDAETGESLKDVDLVTQDSLTALIPAFARSNALLKATPRIHAALPAFPATDGATYNVFPFPFESPNDGGRSVAANAANPAASPYGWHDTNGAAGPEFTVTRGNNAHAYTDLDANNVEDPGSAPDGTPSLIFDFPFSPSMKPDAYRPFAVTNLFYWNNIMHDVTLNYGFDEASGNFQTNNYSGAPGANDYVRAEAQDGSGTNNANFGTPVDGNRPRMQMFVWTHPAPNFLSVTSPGGIAGDYIASRATFGPQLVDVGAVTGNIALANDGVIGGGAPPGTVNDGCEPLVGFPAGSIALVDRGFCTFVTKANNAQLAGAIGVAVAMIAPGDPITLGFTPPIPPITIPVVGVSQATGALIRTNLPVSGSLRSNPLTSINRDSDIDAGVIAHEYTHGISNRLTGGRLNVSCLQNAEQMGEGWSDFFAMTITGQPSDNRATIRGMATYLVFQPRDGGGIRPTQYTTDMTVNPSTYAWVANPNVSQPHGIGYVWATMLWEVYWNLADKYGYSDNIYGPWTSGGNNLALQLVTDGMKLQPCSPGFVDGRNAILAADVALTGGANQCEIWRGFAKRGLGFSASQGLSTNRSDGVEAFDLPAACTAASFQGFTPPVENAPVLNSSNAGAVVPVKFTLTGDPAFGIDSQPVDCSTLIPTGAAPTPVQFPGAAAIKVKDNDYHFNWQTDPAWANSCRRLTLRIPAASDAVAYFSFH